MRALFDLCSGFVYSQVLLACTRLGLFEKLARGPCSAQQLAAELDVPADSLSRLLTAAESLKLIEARGNDEFGLGPLGSAVLGNPAVAMMIEHHAHFYDDLRDPVALLRGDSRPTQLARFWAYAEAEDPAAVQSVDAAAYSELMEASQAMIADQVLAAYPFSAHRRMLDVGGGNGAFAAAALRRTPQLEVTVFDLPAVAQLAEQRFERDDFGRRATAHGGNFLTDPLPNGFDLVTLVRIVHDHDDDQVLELLTAVRRAIADDGVLLIAEPMLDTRGAEPVAAAYFGFYLMAMGQGRPRSSEALRALLHEAGFDSIRRRSTTAPMLARVLVARPSTRTGFS
jgi:demethylspheroidene O-methyltransferase